MDRKKKDEKKTFFSNPEESWDHLHVNRISLFEINLLVTDMRHDLEYRIPGFCLNESHLCLKNLSGIRSQENKGIFRSRWKPGEVSVMARKVLVLVFYQCAFHKV